MITEKEFSQQVVDLARVLDWKVYRTWTSIHSPAGYPDLTMVRGDRLIFAELKTDKGKISAAQSEWLEALGGLINGKVKVYVWTPDDFDEIVKILQGQC